MTFSVNTNAAALNALSVMRATQSELSETQVRVATGLKVASAKDNAAIYAISKNLQSEQAGTRAAISSIQRGISILDVAQAAGETISDLLISLRETVAAVSSFPPGDENRAALALRGDVIIDNIGHFVQRAEFDGVNLLTGTEGVSSTPTPVSSEADIIFSIDGTSSMATTLSKVVSGITAFADKLTSSGVDARFGVQTYSEFGIDQLSIGGVDMSSDVSALSTTLGGILLPGGIENAAAVATAARVLICPSQISA